MVSTVAQETWWASTLSLATSSALLVLLLLLWLALALLPASLDRRNIGLYNVDLALVFGPLSPRLRPLPLPPPPVSFLPLVRSTRSTT